MVPLAAAPVRVKVRLAGTPGSGPNFTSTTVGWLTLPAASVAVTESVLVTETAPAGMVVSRFTSARYSAVYGSAVTVTGSLPPEMVMVLANSAAPVTTMVALLVGLCTGCTRGAGGAVVSFWAQPAIRASSSSGVREEVFMGPFFGGK